MKRLPILACTMLLCGFLVGCGGETQEGLITDTINLIDLAASEVGNIKTSVNTSIKKYEEAVKEGKTVKLDLSDAVKAADKLKETGVKAQEIKRRIEQIRANVTDEQRKEYANNASGKLNEVVKSLLKKNEELRQALDTAEKLNPPSSKIEVDNLRKKIMDSLSPFEALARQQ